MRKLVALVGCVVLASSASIGCAPAEGGLEEDKEFEKFFQDDFENDPEEAEAEAAETEKTDEMDDIFDVDEDPPPTDPATEPVEEGGEGPGPGEGCGEGEDCAPYCPEGEVCEFLCPEGETCDEVCPEGDYCGGCPEGETCIEESLPIAPRPHGPISILQDDPAFSGGKGEDHLARAKELGVDVVRYKPNWRELVPGDPNSTKKPGDFVSSKPDQYNWAKFDATVEGARTAGLKLLLTIPAGPMPYWASEDPSKCAAESNRSCAYKPQYKEYAAFVTAIGRHLKSRGQRIWGVTFVNEPNNPTYLSDDSSLRTAFRYRKLWFSARKAFRLTFGTTRVLYGDLGNNGDKLELSAARWKFFNQSLCLDLKGKEVIDGFCPEKARRVEANGVAFHPYADTPLEQSRSVSFLGKLVSRASRAKRLPLGHGLYMTESAFFTARTVGGKELGVSPSQQAVLMNKADRLLSRNTRVKSIAWFQLVDDGKGRDSGFLLPSLEEKPSYPAYRIGIDVLMVGTKVEVWGLARASAGSGFTVEGQYGSGEWNEIESIRTDMTGFARTRVDKGTATAWRIRFGSDLSRVAK